MAQQQVKLGQPVNRRLGDLLVADGLLSAEQLKKALAEQKGSAEKLGSVLVRLNFVNEDQLIGFLSRQYGVPSITLGQLDIDPDVLRLVPSPIARKYEVVPVRRMGNSLALAMADPTNVFALDDISFMTNLQVLPLVASQTAIKKSIDRNYESKTEAITSVLSDMQTDLANVEVVEEGEEGAKVDVFELKESADEAPVVKLVNMVLVDAIQKGASDIHFESYEKIFRIRFRMDGVLHEMLAPPKRLESTILGEKAVLRILDKEALKLDLTQLGFDEWTLEKFNAAIHQPYGMILITGPTGSGKTTTLYSGIHTINSPDVNIMTAEDPVEYNLKGVNQVQINEGVGRTFAAALRSFLRQDPDVILVGETRDLETAQISIRAALTGHLVFSTLHTNDCPSTVARLLDMGIPPFLIASSLVLIVAQRLARTVCAHCKEPYQIDEGALAPYGHVRVEPGRMTVYRGRGCDRCSFTGTKGRVALYEVMPITAELRDMILKAASTTELRHVAQGQGMKSLRQAGLAKVVEGVTTIEEVLRVTLA